MKRDRTAAWVFAAAVVVRLLHAWRVPVPSTDGPHYLAMADSFGRGAFGSGFACIFHPGQGLVLAPFVALGLDAFVAAKCAGAVLGGVAAVGVLAAARRLAPERAAVLAAVSFGLSFLAVRLPGDAYSEAAFLALVAPAVAAALAGRAMVAAALIGAAYWVRPEALCFLPFVQVRTRLGRSVAAGLLGLACAATYPVIRALVLDSPWVATPKFGFMQPFGPLAAHGFGDLVQQVGANLAALPRAALPALDHVGLPLALIGLVVLWRRDGRTARVFAVCVGLGWLAMVAFQVKARFFVSQLPLLLPLVACALGPRVWRVLLCAGIAVSAVRIARDVFDPPRIEKRVELEVGRRLARDAPRHGELVTDLPRVSYYAGLHPTPPVMWTAELLARVIDRPGTRWVVLGIKHAGRLALMDARSARFERLPVDSDRVGLWVSRP